MASKHSERRPMNNFDFDVNTNVRVLHPTV